MKMEEHDDEGNFYNEQQLELNVEDDEISAEEEGFMLGYLT